MVLGACVVLSLNSFAEMEKIVLQTVHLQYVHKGSSLFQFGF